MDYEWFRTRKAELGLKDAAIAAAAGRERSVINKMMNGAGTFSHERADQLAELFNVSRPEILMRMGYLRPEDVAGHGLPPQPSDRRSMLARANDDDVVEITALDLSLSMGPGTLIEEFVESEPVKMSLNLVQSITRTPSDRLRMVRGIGDSMEPTLRSSDRIMVDINEKQLTRISGIYWINREGAHGIKRLRPAGKGRIAIISDNPIEGNDEVDASELRIEGRVIWFAREL
jgi:transcriptional regulator with XRE-family HTH domain